MTQSASSEGEMTGLREPVRSITIEVSGVVLPMALESPDITTSSRAPRLKSVVLVSKLI